MNCAHFLYVKTGYDDLRWLETLLRFNKTRPTFCIKNLPTTVHLNIVKKSKRAKKLAATMKLFLYAWLHLPLQMNATLSATNGFSQRRDWRKNTQHSTHNRSGYEIFIVSKPTFMRSEEKLSFGTNLTHRPLL